MLRKHVDNEPLWMPKEGLPAGGRDECRYGERPCPYVHCEWHLWMIDTTDRNGGVFHEGKLTHDIKPKSTLVPRWLEYPTPPCCGYDIAELMRDRRTRVVPIHLLAYAFNVTEDWMRTVIDRALAKIEVLKEFREP